MHIDGLVESEEKVLRTCSFRNCRCTAASEVRDRAGLLRFPRRCILPKGIFENGEGTVWRAKLSRSARGSGTRRRAATLDRATDDRFLSQCLRAVNEPLLHATLMRTQTAALNFPGPCQREIFGCRSLAESRAQTPLPLTQPSAHFDRDLSFRDVFSRSASRTGKDKA